MTDRELMMLAAKAAGIALRETQHGVLIAKNSLNPLAGEAWNPLTDDGDALRLAVRLRLDIEQGNVHAYALMPVPPFTGGMAKVGGDRVAATRRAIVRAAAEIGRLKP